MKCFFIINSDLIYNIQYKIKHACVKIIFLHYISICYENKRTFTEVILSKEYSATSLLLFVINSFGNQVKNKE